ncbi:hypothetical protein D3C76_1634800 [compost metagenome]
MGEVGVGNTGVGLYEHCLAAQMLDMQRRYPAVPEQHLGAWHVEAQAQRANHKLRLSINPMHLITAGTDNGLSGAGKQFRDVHHFALKQVPVVRGEAA